MSLDRDFSLLTAFYTMHPNEDGLILSNARRIATRNEVAPPRPNPDRSADLSHPNILRRHNSENIGQAVKIGREVTTLSDISFSFLIFPCRLM